LFRLDKSRLKEKTLILPLIKTPAEPYKLLKINAVIGDAGSFSNSAKFSNLLNLNDLLDCASASEARCH